MQFSAEGEAWLQILLTRGGPLSQPEPLLFFPFLHINGVDKREEKRGIMGICKYVRTLTFFYTFC